MRCSERQTHTLHRRCELSKPGQPTTTPKTTQHQETKKYQNQETQLRKNKLESDLKKRAQKGPRKPLPVADKSRLQLGTATTFDAAFEPHEIGDGIVLEELLRRPIFLRCESGRRRG